MSGNIEKKITFKKQEIRQAVKKETSCKRKGETERKELGQDGLSEYIKIGDKNIRKDFQ